MKNSGVTVYNFDGLYVTSAMKSPDFFGIAGYSGVVPFVKSSSFFEFVKSTGVFSFAKGEAFPPDLNGFNFCSEIAGSCFDYYRNSAKFYYVEAAYRVIGIVRTVEYDVIVWMLLVVVMYMSYTIVIRRDVARYVSTDWFAKRTLAITTLLTVVVQFTCSLEFWTSEYRFYFNALFIKMSFRNVGIDLFFYQQGCSLGSF